MCAGSVISSTAIHAFGLANYSTDMMSCHYAQKQKVTSFSIFHSVLLLALLVGHCLLFFYRCVAFAHDAFPPGICA